MTIILRLTDLSEQRRISDKVKLTNLIESPTETERFIILSGGSPSPQTHKAISVTPMSDRRVKVSFTNMIRHFYQEYNYTI